MEVTEKMYSTLFNNINYALKRLEDAERQIAESKLLLQSSRILAEEMYINKEKSVE